MSDSESSDDEVVKKKIKLDESTDEDMPKPKGNKLKVKFDGIYTNTYVLFYRFLLLI